MRGGRELDVAGAGGGFAVVEVNGAVFIGGNRILAEKAGHFTGALMILDGSPRVGASGARNALLRQS